MTKVRPPHIIAAILVDDIQQLQVSGAAGGRKSAELRRKRQADREAVDAYLSEKNEKEEWRRLVSTNAHIVPFDPDEVTENR